MIIDPAKLEAYAVASHKASHLVAESGLYHLGPGLGHDPVDRDVLPFIYGNWGPKVLPTPVTVIGDPNRWLADPAAGLGEASNVHGDQTIEIHAPIPAEGAIKSATRITGLYDRGFDSHAALTFEEEIVDATTGQALATQRQTDVLIGAGGFGGPPPRPGERTAMPERSPDAIRDHPVPSEAALIYRLSNDYATFHVETAEARAAGFKHPILHGLATYGITCHCCCDHDPECIERFHGRFTAPVYPGDLLRTATWCDGSSVWFETRAVDRDTVAFANGRAELKEHALGY